jgi:hypothetical protein
MTILVEFHSNQFPPDAGEEAQINPGLWGKRLAEYLQASLPRYGIAVHGISPEDWGWMVELENPDFPLWIGCGHQDGEDREFLCFIEPSQPFVRKWFKKIGTRDHVNRVAAALETLLKSDAEIHAIRWSGR